MKKILILAGGGGHTGYAKILAEELQGRAELSFLAPEDDPLSKELLREYGPVDQLINPATPRPQPGDGLSGSPRRSTLRLVRLRETWITS